MTTTADTPTLSPQHDPSLCPPWCHREHLLDADEGDGFHHDGEPVVVVPAFRQCLDEPDQIFVKPSRFVPLDGSFRPVLVELQSSSHMLAGLSPAEARELAQTLCDAAALAEELPQTHKRPARGEAPPATERVVRPPVDITAADLTPQDGHPFWQTEPCPTWCSKGHEASDHPEDRKHWNDTDGQRLQLTLHALERNPDTGGWYDDPPVLDVYLVQHVREAEPGINLSFNEATATSLTMAEADRLRVALGTLLTEADGVARPGATTTCAAGIAWCRGDSQDCDGTIFHRGEQWYDALSRRSPHCGDRPRSAHDGRAVPGARFRGHVPQHHRAPQLREGDLPRRRTDAHHAAGHQWLGRPGSWCWCRPTSPGRTRRASGWHPVTVPPAWWLEERDAGQERPRAALRLVTGPPVARTSCRPGSGPCGRRGDV